MSLTVTPASTISTTRHLCAVAFYNRNIAGVCASSEANPSHIKRSLTRSSSGILRQLMRDTCPPGDSRHGSHNLGSRLSAAKRPCRAMCARSDGS